MHSLPMQLKLSCVMIRHSARHAIELLQMETVTVTITNHIQLLECVEKSATRMGTDVPASMNTEQRAEVIFRLSLVMNLMDYNTSGRREENYAPYLRWDAYREFMRLLTLETIPLESQEVVPTGPCLIRAMTAIASLGTIPGGVYWKEMSPLHAMCFNICMICMCMTTRLLSVYEI